MDKAASSDAIVAPDAASRGGAELGDGKLNVDSIKRKWLDIPYTPQADTRRLDIYLPGEGEGPFPALVWLHGGGWMGGDKREKIQLQPLLPCLDRGYALVSVNYRLSTVVKFPGQLLDVWAALSFLLENGQKYRIKRGCAGLWGGSAGGHLAALAATCREVPGLAGAEAKIEADSGCGSGIRREAAQAGIKAVSVISAVTDLYDFAAWEAGKATEEKTSGFPYPPADFLLGRPAIHSEEAARSASAITHISPHTPPFYLCHGSLDNVVDISQSLTFADALRRAAGGSRVRLSVVEGAGHHGDPALLPPEEISAQLDFFDRYLRYGDAPL